MIGRVYAVERAHIDADLVRVRTAIVKNVNAADFAEMVPRGVCPLLIMCQRALPLHNLHTVFGCGDGRCCAPAAERTVTTRCGRQPICQGDVKHNGSAMTGGPHRRTFGMRDGL